MQVGQMIWLSCLLSVICACVSLTYKFFSSSIGIMYACTACCQDSYQSEQLGENTSQPRPKTYGTNSSGVSNDIQPVSESESDKVITQQPQSDKLIEDREQECKGRFPHQEDQRQMITLQQRVKELEKENKELLQTLSPNQLVKLQSKGLRETGCFEDLSDKNSNIKLRERFSRIYKKEWFQLYRALRKIFKDEELRLLSFISDIMKSIYADCKIKAVDGFAYGNKNPLSDDVFSLNELRKRNGQTEIALGHITMELKRKYNLLDQTGRKLSIRKRCDSMDSTVRDLSEKKRKDPDTVDDSVVTFGSVNECSKYILSRAIHEIPDVVKTFESFFVAFVECSWLMVVSDPPIELHFDEAVGKTLDEEMKEHFKKYPTNELVTKPKTVGTIIQIVWPELDDNHGSHLRGFVITVDRSSETEV